ncbi:two-component system sensor histidine kinase/response regulator [Arenibacter sp. TNZ]|jgi:signal transduction histidine kinase/BarA-like signal transduction histidine kinase|uniref:response regulator n=1 Tax=Arenibacter TaxID=178469 RepID=UPI000CD3AC1D|nr:MULTISPECIES: response regulator [Arenibacter]MCM4170792.1 two-component system sensor histidine kinase/response regulator [Arenibacter sp. TNZ]
MSEFSKRRVKLVFTLSLVTTIITVIWFFIARSLDIQELSNYIGATAPFFILSAVISKKGNLTLARFIFMIAFNLSVTLTASFVGKAGSVEFILMFAMALPFVLFSFRREKLFIAIFSGLSMIFWFLLYFTDFNLFTNIHMDAVQAGKYIYPISIATTIFLVTYQLIYFSYINAGFYSKIHNQREVAIEASNAKSRFLSMMSHEIRTPLNAITGLSHILGDSNPREDQKQNIEALNYSGKILLNLLNNVLDFSKMESTKIELDPIPTDIMAAVKQIKKIHEPSCLRKGIAFELEIDKELPVVWLDIVRFNQVINNLVTNAIKFTDKGGVTLKIVKQEETDGHVLMRTEIIDTGIGIPEEQQEKIWQAFTQASSSTNRLYGGTGLGLPIVKGIVEAMGSMVKVESEMEVGSRFYFDLELKLASSKELDQITQKKVHDLKGKKVLLVEDNQINVMVGRQILEKANLVVDVAYDGLIAVNKVRESNYDALLMDIQMPVMDGYTASREIRKFNTTVPILALSASVFQEVKDKMIESGMDGFIFKPFDPIDLLNKIEEIMEK